MEGRKNDENKIELTLIDFHFIENIARVLQYGALKYEPENWKRLSRKRILDAFLRHAFAIAKGEIYDPDSGFLHIHHAAANLMFLDFFIRNDMEFTDNANS